MSTLFYGDVSWARKALVGPFVIGGGIVIFCDLFLLRFEWYRHLRTSYVRYALGRHLHQMKRIIGRIDHAARGRDADAPIKRKKLIARINALRKCSAFLGLPPTSNIAIIATTERGWYRGEQWKELRESLIVEIDKYRMLWRSA